MQDLQDQIRERTGRVGGRVRAANIAERIAAGILLVGIITVVVVGIVWLTLEMFAA